MREPRAGRRSSILDQVWAGLIVAAILAIAGFLAKDWLGGPESEPPPPPDQGSLGAQLTTPAVDEGSATVIPDIPADSQAPASTQKRDIAIRIEDAPTDKVLETGVSYSVSGNVAGLPEGSEVELVTAEGSRTLGTGVVDAEGAFAIEWEFRQAGADMTLLVQADQSEETLETHEQVGVYDVLRWQALSDYEPVSQTKNVELGGQASLDAQLFDPSIIFQWSAASFGGWEDGDVTFNLGRACTRFRATVGVDDSSPGDLAAWRFVVSGDDTLTSTDFLGVGSPEPVTADVTDVLRITLSGQRLAPEGADWQPYKADAVWGEPEVLCEP